jgi:glycosyltransferase involved in cell wall biosynthesis
MKKILSIATAGLYADQVRDVNHRNFPRVDYVELQRLLNADTIDYSAYDQTFAGSLFRRVEREIRSDIYLTAISWRKSRAYSTVFTWSERAGIPFSGFRRLLPSNVRFVTMFQSWSKRQETTLTGLRLFPVMDAIIVHCESMKRNLIRFGAPAEKTHVIHYSIDEEFFSPQAGLTPEPGRIVSLGETRSRDYASLFKAIEGLPVRLEVAGYGHWYAREKNNVLKEKIPANVSISRRLTHLELRDFYARSAFVVLPVSNLVYSAGATAALEAGSMGRAVIAFHSQGISDYIIDGMTGIIIDPGDVAGLKAAIQRLHANPAEAQRLGVNARQRILEQFRLDSYVNQIAGVLLQN